MRWPDGKWAQFAIVIIALIVLATYDPSIKATLLEILKSIFG